MNCNVACELCTATEGVIRSTVSIVHSIAGLGFDLCSAQTNNATAACNPTGNRCEFKVDCIPYSKLEAIAVMLELTEKLDITVQEVGQELCITVCDGCDPLIALGKLRTAVTENSAVTASAFGVLGIQLVSLQKEIASLKQAQTIYVSEIADLKDKVDRSMLAYHERLHQASNALKSVEAQAGNLEESMADSQHPCSLTLEPVGEITTIADFHSQHVGEDF